jgi:uncharacterized caspase-like protein
MATASERFPRLARLARSPLLWMAVLVVLGCVIRSARKSDVRGMSLVSLPAPAADAKPGQIAALFVGVQEFTSNPAPDSVEYAVDDAVDLASAFAERIGDPKRIALAITGEPHKKGSQAALQKLRDRGATIEPPSKEAIARLLERQATVAGSNGELIVSFATHGVSEGGVHYVLASGSSFEDHDSLLSTAEMLDVASHVRRSIIFLDACRERATTVRGASHRANTKAPSLKAMKQYAGQVVFSPAAGRDTYDDPDAKNGVFTAAIVHGLQDCSAKRDPQGFVTVATLQDYVDSRVRRWLKKHHHDFSPPAIQVNTDGDSSTLPLARCEPIREIGDVHFTDHSIDAFDTDGQHIWGRSFGDVVTCATFAQPPNIVVAAVGRRIMAFDVTNHEIWTRDLGERVLVKMLIADKLLYGVPGEQIAALAEGEGGSSISVWDADGNLRGTYRHPAELNTLLLTHLTARHGAKLVAASATDVFMLDPKELDGGPPPGQGSQLWYGKITPPERAIRSVSTDDVNHDGKLDIAVKLAGGYRLYLDFEGHRVDSGDAGGAHFELLAPAQRSARQRIRRPIAHRTPLSAITPPKTTR